MRTMMDEHVVMIGPWGWVGWLVACAVGYLYYMLWVSSSNRERIKLREELNEARKIIADLEDKHGRTNTLLQKIHEEYNELSASYHELTMSFERLGRDFAKLQSDLKEERELRMQQYGELLKERAKHGDL